MTNPLMTMATQAASATIPEDGNYASEAAYKHDWLIARDSALCALEASIASTKAAEDRTADMRQDFAQAFDLVFEAYNKPADAFRDYEAWALWQHRKIIKAFGHLQKVRAALNGTDQPGDGS